MTEEDIYPAQYVEALNRYHGETTVEHATKLAGFCLRMAMAAQPKTVGSRLWYERRALWSDVARLRAQV